LNGVLNVILDEEKKAVSLNTACAHDYNFKVIIYFVSIKRLLRVRRRRYSSPACM